MSHKRHVWETVSSMAARLKDLSNEDLIRLEKEMGKLGREQYKANTLAQAQAERLQAALEALQMAMSRQEAAQREVVEKARLDTLKAMLPVLDGLEAGLQSGARQARQLYRQRSPAATILIAWLDGQRLLRDRFLALLDEAGIRPIETIGMPFDPYRHVAVGTVEDEMLPDGQIVGEERRGYAAGDHVLRYAEVVVAKKKGAKAEDKVQTS